MLACLGSVFSLHCSLSAEPDVSRAEEIRCLAERITARGRFEHSPCNKAQHWYRSLWRVRAFGLRLRCTGRRSQRACVQTCADGSSRVSSSWSPHPAIRCSKLCSCRWSWSRRRLADGAVSACHAPGYPTCRLCWYTASANCSTFTGSHDDLRVGLQRRLDYSGWHGHRLHASAGAADRRPTRWQLLALKRVPPPL